MTDSPASLQGMAKPSTEDAGLANAMQRSATHLPSAAEGVARSIALAPACFDIAGGIAEYSGANVVPAPCCGGVIVTAQRRDDGAFTASRVQSGDDDGSPDTFEFPARDSTTLQGRADECWLRAVKGAVTALHGSDKLNGAGADLVIDLESLGHVDTGLAASIATAVVAAVCRVCGVACEPAECVHLATRALNAAGHHCGPGAALSVMSARRDQVAQICCRTLAIKRRIEIPRDITFVGVDCGFKSEQADVKYDRVRTAVRMGHAFIEQIFKTTTFRRQPWDGTLADIPVHEYVEELKSRLPVKMKGAAFLERFGREADTLTTVDAEQLYRIRSRTEHHIYEAERTRRFGDCMALVADSGSARALAEAGELLCASHWSYGQRCGLGSVQTDRLVRIIRNRGGSSGLHGARVSGQGSGGVVVVMMDDTSDARQELNDVLREYASIVHLTPSIIELASNGVAEFSVSDV